MQVCKYASMQVCKYASMQVCKYASMQVCKYAHMQVGTDMQVCKYTNKCEAIYMSAIAAFLMFQLKLSKYSKLEKVTLCDETSSKGE